MILTVNRGPSRPEGTFGKAVLDDGTTYACLELPWKDNMPGLSCIAIGMYNAVVTMSPHLGMDTYELQSVPARSDIRIHIGNFGGDVSLGLRSDILGCILLGTSTGILTQKDMPLRRLYWAQEPLSTISWPVLGASRFRST